MMQVYLHTKEKESTTLAIQRVQTHITYHTDIINLLQYTIAFTPDSDSECEVRGTGKTPFLLLYIYVLIIII